MPWREAFVDSSRLWLTAGRQGCSDNGHREGSVACDTARAVDAVVVAAVTV